MVQKPKHTRRRLAGWLACLGFRDEKQLDRTTVGGLPGWPARTRQGRAAAAAGSAELRLSRPAASMNPCRLPAPSQHIVDRHIINVVESARRPQETPREGPTLRAVAGRCGLQAGLSSVYTSQASCDVAKACHGRRG